MKMPEQALVFESRLVEQIKHEVACVRFKSRLVPQNYGDTSAGYIATKDPIVQRFTQRLMFSLAATLNCMNTYSRDATQAYIQWRTQLEPEVHIHQPEEMDTPSDHVLKVVKPLYSIP